MKINLDNTPNDVIWVWLIQSSSQPVGSSTILEINKIIKEYPEYFPWEHKYNSIPNEVHEAFMRECYPEKYKPITFDEFDGINNGLMAQLPKVEYAYNALTSKDIKEFFDNMEKQNKEKIEAQKNETQRVKEIWDKYYSNYKLEFRK